MKRDKIVIGISSRALFDLTMENELFEQEGLNTYRSYQAEHEKDILRPGSGFALVQALLGLNRFRKSEPLVEVVIMSRNSPVTSLRVFNSIRHYGLPISRAILVSGAPLAPYLSAFHTDLFLSAHEDDVQYAVDNGIAAGIICTEPNVSGVSAGTDSVGRQYQPIRLAFDGDAVLFDGEAERIFLEKGLTAFEENEKLQAEQPLPEGPFANLLMKLTNLREIVGEAEDAIRIALVTSRCAPAHERVIRTLQNWNVGVDEAFFLGGMDKSAFLKAFGAQIFFDDQYVNTQSAAQVVPAARVPSPRAS